MRITENEIIIERIKDLYRLSQDKVSKNKSFWVSSEKIVSAFKKYWKEDELDLYYKENYTPFPLYEELIKIKEEGNFISIDLLFSESYFYYENLTETSAYNLLFTPFFTIFPNNSLFVPEITIKKEELVIKTKEKEITNNKYKIMI